MSTFFYSDRLVRMNCDQKTFARTPTKEPVRSVFNSPAILASSSPFKTRFESTVVQKVTAMGSCKILEAPGIEDDFYTEILSWSSKNIIAVALKPNVYLYHPETCKVQSIQIKSTKHSSVSHGCASISSLAWNPQGNHLAVGHKNGLVKLWDLTTLKCIKEQKLHSNRIATLSWNECTLSTGSKDYSIKHLDIRVKSPSQTYRWHAGEICGLKWDKNGARLISGGDDNQVCVWDVRKGSEPNWCIRDFNGAVKAIDWCPTEASMFVTGGGSTDRRIKIWSTKTNTCLDIVDTGSQICSLIWSKPGNRIVSSHGFIENDIAVWKYPKLVKTTVMKGHSLRVLHTAISPDHGVIASTSGDESLRLWKLHDPDSDGKSNFSDQNLFCKVLK